MRYHGYHLGAWRHPDVPEAGTLDYRYFLNTARIAEAAKFDMVFFADGIGIRVRDEPEGSLCRSPQTVELEPLTLYAAIATHTEHIGDQVLRHGQLVRGQAVQAQKQPPA